MIGFFIDSTRELEFRAGTWQDRRAQLIVVLGRRRVGKTALRRELAWVRRVVHFVAPRLLEAQKPGGRLETQGQLPHHCGKPNQAPGRQVLRMGCRAAWLGWDPRWTPESCRARFVGNREPTTSPSRPPPTRQGGPNGMMTVRDGSSCMLRRKDA